MATADELKAREAQNRQLLADLRRANLRRRALEVYGGVKKVASGGASIFSKTWSMNTPRRGPKQGASYSNPMPNKYRYSRTGDGKPRKLGINATWKRLFGSKQTGTEETTATATKSYRSGSAPSLQGAYQGASRLLASQFNKKIYEQNLKDFDVLPEPEKDWYSQLKEAQTEAEAEVFSDVRQISGYERKLQQSAEYYRTRKLKLKNDIERTRAIVKMQTENLKKSNIINAENMFSRDNPANDIHIDINQNVFSASNPDAIDITKKRADSINILKSDRPSILKAEYVFASSTNILKAKPLNFGLIKPNEPSEEEDIV